jgi:hypothetical protein
MPCLASPNHQAVLFNVMRAIAVAVNLAQTVRALHDEACRTVKPFQHYLRRAALVVHFLLHNGLDVSEGVRG